MPNMTSKSPQKSCASPFKYRPCQQKHIWRRLCQPNRPSAFSGRPGLFPHRPENCCSYRQMRHLALFCKPEEAHRPTKSALTVLPLKPLGPRPPISPCQMGASIIAQGIPTSPPLDTHAGEGGPGRRPAKKIVLFSF